MKVIIKLHNVGRLGVVQDVATHESGFSLEKVGQVTMRLIRISTELLPFCLHKQATGQPSFSGNCC